MKTRYSVFKSGYWDEDPKTYVQNRVDAILKARFETEAKAIALLRTLDADWHYITKEDYVHIDDGIFDWETDESYGCDGAKFLWEFSESV